MFDPRIRKLVRFEPHPFPEAEQALPKGAFDEAIYDNVKKRYSRLENVAIERIEYGVDGLNVTGVFTHPANITPGTHPIMIFNRGGNGAFGNLILPVILRYMMPFAEQGYLVFGSNYRGNDGGEGTEEFGGNDIHDVLTLLDIARQHPGWDGKNIFMLGGSRGGMMTYLAIKHGAPLNAAASFAGVSDVWQLLADRPEMARIFANRLPDHDAGRDAQYEARSAVRWPQALKNTPLLLLHGTADTSVTIAHSRALIQELQNVGAEAKLVEYEGGNHSLSTHAKEFLIEVSRWFDQHRA